MHTRRKTMRRAAIPYALMQCTAFGVNEPWNLSLMSPSPAVKELWKLLSSMKLRKRVCGEITNYWTSELLRPITEWHAHCMLASRASIGVHMASWLFSSDTHWPIPVYLLVLRASVNVAIQSCLLSAPAIRVGQNIVFVCFSIPMNRKTVSCGGNT